MNRYGTPNYLPKNYMESVLKDFFIGKGCKLIAPGELKLPDDVVEDLDIILRDASNIIFIKIVSEYVRTYVRSRKIIEKILSKLIHYYKYADKVYLAIPRGFILKSSFDRDFIRNLGVGIIEVDEQGRVSELYPAIPRFKRWNYQMVQPSFPKLDLLERRLSLLEERVLKLESRLSEICEELKHRSEFSSMIAEAKVSTTPAKVVDIEEELEGLPEYVRDNEWVNVLISRRRVKK